MNVVCDFSFWQDVDAYIHRSGRTGRAGRMGTCLCFYKPQEEYGLLAVERRAVCWQFINYVLYNIHTV